MDAGLAPERLEAGIRARRYLSGLIDPAISGRKPESGLLSRIEFAAAGEELPYLVNSVRTIFVAGHSSAGSMLVNAVHALLAHGLLRGDPPLRLDATGFNELVRLEGPVQAVSRAVVSDTEIGGVRLRRGDVAVAVLASANRDPAVFDHADTLLLDRADNLHLGFGRGVHGCLGIRLAALLGVAVIEVLTRNHGVELAGCPVRRPSATVRSLDHLPVRLRPLRSAKDPITSVNHALERA
jgi:cytochrome P450